MTLLTFVNSTEEPDIMASTQEQDRPERFQKEEEPRDANYAQIETNHGVIKLRKEHNEFARLYAITGRIGSSAKEIGIKRITAYKYMKRDDVLEAVEYWKEQHAGKLELSEQRIMAEYTAIATSNIADLFDDAGEVRPIQEVPEPLQHCIKRVRKRVDKDGGVTWDIHLWEKLEALNRLSEIKGITAGEGNGQVNVNINVD